MDKCKEAFEQLPEIKDSLSENIVFIGNKYTTANEGFYDLVNWLNGGWYIWQSRQTEINQLQTQINEMAEVGLNQESVIREKDKKLKAVEQILIELKESMTNFKEMDLYDKGVRVVTDCIIRDLEKALRGEHDL